MELDQGALSKGEFDDDDLDDEDLLEVHNAIFGEGAKVRHLRRYINPNNNARDNSIPFSTIDSCRALPRSV
jgi:hypothetical protein